MNELTGLSFTPESKTGPLAVTKGEQVLQSIGYSKSTISNALSSLGRIIAFNYAFTYFVLVRLQPRFEPIQRESDEEKANENKSANNNTESEATKLITYPTKASRSVTLAQAKTNTKFYGKF